MPSKRLQQPAALFHSNLICPSPSSLISTVRFSPKKAYLKTYIYIKSIYIYIYVSVCWRGAFWLTNRSAFVASVQQSGCHLSSDKVFKCFPGPRSTSSSHERVWTSQKAADRTPLSGITSHTCATVKSWCSFWTGSLTADNSRLDSCCIYWDLHMLHVLKTLLSVALSPCYVCLFRMTHPDLTANNPPRMPSRP